MKCWDCDMHVKLVGAAGFVGPCWWRCCVPWMEAESVQCHPSRTRLAGTNEVGGRGGECRPGTTWSRIFVLASVQLHLQPHLSTALCGEGERARLCCVCTCLLAGWGFHWLLVCACAGACWHVQVVGCRVFDASCYIPVCPHERKGTHLADNERIASDWPTANNRLPIFSKDGVRTEVCEGPTCSPRTPPTKNAGTAM